MAYRIVGKFGNYTWLCLVQLLLAIHIAQCGLWIVYSIDLSTLAFSLCGLRVSVGIYQYEYTNA